jgi:hypothetical protein
MTSMDRLVAEIRRGNCVAFIGAGFSAPSVQGWVPLLQSLASSAGPGTHEQVVRLTDSNPTSKNLEAAAQILKDNIGAQAFSQALKSVMPAPPFVEMQQRLNLLKGIPFRSVLTTNFDGILPGIPIGRDAYQQVLRPSGHRWWDERFWKSERGPEVVHLHGNVEAAEGVVFTRSDYRRRIYSSPGYTTFLRAVMSTTTVLYLGFSFTDAYLDELRSEVLALLDYEGGDTPIAYALLHGVGADEIAYARSHEGIEVIPYSADSGHEEFDEFLAALHDRTNPKAILGGYLAQKRIGWVDPDEISIDLGMQFLESAAKGAAQIDRFDSAVDAVNAAAENDFDLIVTRWGHGEGSTGEAVAVELLKEIRARDVRAPVVVFASGSHADANKRIAMGLGATSYEYSWEGLFQEVERIFTPGSGRP